MQTLEQQRPREDPGVGLWLLWALPPIAVTVLLGFVISVTFGVDLRLVTANIVAGRGGEVVAPLSVFIGQFLTQLIALAVQDWPLLIAGAALAATAWVLKSESH